MGASATTAMAIRLTSNGLAFGELTDRTLYVWQLSVAAGRN